MDADDSDQQFGLSRWIPSRSAFLSHCASAAFVLILVWLVSGWLGNGRGSSGGSNEKQGIAGRGEAQPAPANVSSPIIEDLIAKPAAATAIPPTSPQAPVTQQQPQQQPRPIIEDLSPISQKNLSVPLVAINPNQPGQPGQPASIGNQPIYLEVRLSPNNTPIVRTISPQEISAAVIREAATRVAAAQPRPFKKTTPPAREIALSKTVVQQREQDRPNVTYQRPAGIPVRRGLFGRWR